MKIRSMMKMIGVALLTVCLLLTVSCRGTDAGEEETSGELVTGSHDDSLTVKSLLVEYTADSYEEVSALLSRDDYPSYTEVNEVFPVRNITAMLTESGESAPWIGFIFTEEGWVRVEFRGLTPEDENLLTDWELSDLSANVDETAFAEVCLGYTMSEVRAIDRNGVYPVSDPEGIHLSIHYLPSGNIVQLQYDDAQAVTAIRTL